MNAIFIILGLALLALLEWVAERPKFKPDYLVYSIGAILSITFWLFEHKIPRYGLTGVIILLICLASKPLTRALQRIFQ